MNGIPHFNTEIANKCYSPSFGDESKLVGHWRRKHQKKSSPEG